MGTLGKTWKWKKGHSEEYKKRMSERLIGNKYALGLVHTTETKKKISQFNTGRVVSEYSRQRTRETWLGRKHTLEARSKISLAMIGRERLPVTMETRIKLSEGQKGEKGSNWKGGITPFYRSIRTSFRYRLWRESVFKRDNYTCVWCGEKSGNGKAVTLNADHVKPLFLFPELIFDLNNCRTLCIDCHKKTKTYGRPKNLMQPQLQGQSQPVLTQ